MSAAMLAGEIAYIDTPAQGNTRPAGVTWCADNGAFSDNWDADKWWRFLKANAHDAATCLFAVAPDVVGDAEATLERSAPWLPKIRALGYPVAFVAQDGLESLEVPWDDFDVLFIGGTTDWKLGIHARRLVEQAKARGMWVHMGRVNSEKRWLYADAIGCDSVDGTILTRGPDVNLRRVRTWLRHNDQDVLDRQGVTRQQRGRMTDDQRPCLGQNTNVCVAEGCYGEACTSPPAQPTQPGTTP